MLVLKHRTFHVNLAYRSNAGKGISQTPIYIGFATLILALILMINHVHFNNI